MITRYRIDKGGCMSVYQARWDVLAGRCFADVEVWASKESADAHRFLVGYGYERGPSWAIEVPSVRDGEAVVEWLARQAVLHKPETMAEWRGSPLVGLRVRARSQYGDAPPGMAVAVARTPATEIDLG